MKKTFKLLSFLICLSFSSVQIAMDNSQDKKMDTTISVAAAKSCDCTCGESCTCNPCECPTATKKDKKKKKAKLGKKFVQLLSAKSKK